MFPVAPKMSPFSFGEEPYEENQYVSVSCSVVKGDFPLNISWMFNNNSISNGQIAITQVGRQMSVLAIESVKGHHAGIYSCVGQNQAGFDTHSANLLVNGLLSSDRLPSFSVHVLGNLLVHHFGFVVPSQC